MRKLIVAAATAATVSTLGLTATAQALSVNQGAGRAPAAVTKTVVAGIPAAFTIVQPGTAKCTWKTTGLPGPVTSGTGGANNCTNLIDGVFPKAGTVKITAKVTHGGALTIIPITVTVKATPGENDAVGVGSDTITPVTDQLAGDFNTTVKSATATHEYSWDAVNPITGKIGDTIAEKAGCPKIMRPDGSSAGIAQLATFTKSSSGPFCTNFARSSRSRATTDPPFAKGGVAFTTLAGDAVTWSTQTTTNAPKTLTPAQLASIFTCQVTNWSQVGGKSAPIKAFLPQSGSGTLSFWLAALGNITPGPCVSDANNLLEENEGVNKVLQSPNAIFIYSIGDFIAQSQHSAKCVNTNVKAGTACTPNKSGVVCVHVPSKNWFSCDLHGTMKLGAINGIAPTTGSGASQRINPAFPATFDRTLFNVVPFDPATTDHIPGKTKPVGGVNLATIFGHAGFDCASKATTDLKNYGFIPLGGNCGKTN
jgi:ABC-type phosphate transport system substrate-binding protein